MRVTRAFLSRLNGSLRTQHLERELAEEFESHLAMQIADNLRAGMSPEQGARPQLRAATDPAARGGEFYAPRFVNNGPPVRRPILRRIGCMQA